MKYELQNKINQSFSVYDLNSKKFGFMLCEMDHNKSWNLCSDGYNHSCFGHELGDVLWCKYL